VVSTPVGADLRVRPNTRQEGAHAGAPLQEPAEFALFGERGARAVVTCKPEALVRLQLAASQYRVAALDIGRVTSGACRIQLNGEAVIASDVESLREVWATALEKSVSS